MPVPHKALEQRRVRRLDVQVALAEGQCMADLARKWGVSKPRVHEWCKQHLSSDDHRALADNGVASIGQKLRDWDLGKRLELVALCRANGWSWSAISDALGVSYHSIWRMMKVHAPDGLDAALEDFREDEAA